MAPTASHESLGQGYAHSCDSVDNMSDCSTPTGQSRLNFTGATIHDVPVAIGTPQPTFLLMGRYMTWVVSFGWCHLLYIDRCNPHNVSCSCP